MLCLFPTLMIGLVFSCCCISFPLNCSPIAIKQWSWRLLLRLHLLKHITGHPTAHRPQTLACTALIVRGESTAILPTKNQGQLCSLRLLAMVSWGISAIWDSHLSTVGWMFLLLCCLGIDFANLCINSFHVCRRFIRNNWRLHGGPFIFQREHSGQSFVHLFYIQSVGNQLLQMAFSGFWKERLMDTSIQTFFARSVQGQGANPQGNHSHSHLHLRAVKWIQLTK